MVLFLFSSFRVLAVLASNFYDEFFVIVWINDGFLWASNLKCRTSINNFYVSYIRFLKGSAVNNPIELSPVVIVGSERVMNFIIFRFWYLKRKFLNYVSL